MLRLPRQSGLEDKDAQGLLAEMLICTREIADCLANGQTDSLEGLLNQRQDLMNRYEQFTQASPESVSQKRRLLQKMLQLDEGSRASLREQLSFLQNKMSDAQQEKKALRGYAQSQAVSGAGGIFFSQKK